MQWKDDAALPIDETAMHPELPRATRPGCDHRSVPYGGAQRSALICLTVLASTGIWAALFGLCSWLLDIPMRPNVLAGILIAIFFFQLLALSLIAGAADGPDPNSADAVRGTHAAGVAAGHGACMTEAASSSRPRNATIGWSLCSTTQECTFPRGKPSSA
jgi:hypothetical protein